jgi:hypothetical protein
MIYDHDTLFSDSQAITVLAPSTIIYDCGPVTDICRGQEQSLDVRVVETVTASGAATVTVELQTASDAAFAVPTTLLTSGPISKSSLVQGYQIFEGAMPRGCLRYLRLNYVVATGPLTAGKFTAALSIDGNAGAQPVRTGAGVRV